MVLTSFKALKQYLLLSAIFLKNIHIKNLQPFRFIFKQKKFVFLLGKVLFNKIYLFTLIKTWLLGYEWRDTLILLTQDKIHFVAKEKMGNKLFCYYFMLTNYLLNFFETYYSRSFRTIKSR